MVDRLEKMFGKLTGNGFNAGKGVVNPKKGEKYVKKRF